MREKSGHSKVLQAHQLADKPIEFVFGLKDLGTGPAEMDRWQSHFSNGNVQKISEAYHYTQEDCPDNYVIAIRNILGQEH